MQNDTMMTYLERLINMDKIFTSENYNQVFNDQTGYHAYWGKTKDENPEWCEYGPSILDLEISAGKCAGNCKFCYKNNGLQHNTIENMSFDTFKKVFDGFNKNILTQIAFGLCDIDSNPDMWAMFEHCRSEGIVPNFTCNGIGVTKELAERTASLCGAVAVSLVNKEQSYNAIKSFIDAGMKQVNIHFMLSEETYEEAFTVLNDIKTDPRLAKLNAIVFLQYKPKGNGIGKFHCINSVKKYEKLLNHAEKLKVGVGFDSCSAPLYLKTLAETKPTLYKILSTYAEPCESGLFSSYINYKGEFFPCSFSEGVNGWLEGIKVLDYPSFKEVWHHPRLEEWRTHLIKSSSNCKCFASKDCRNCPIYPEVSPCKKKLSPSPQL